VGEARKPYLELESSFQQSPDKIVPLCDLQNKKATAPFLHYLNNFLFLINFEAVNTACIFKAIYTECVFASFLNNYHLMF